MPATPEQIAALRLDLRNARAALYAIGQARRAELLMDRNVSGYLGTVATGRALLQATRVALREALAS